MFITLLENINKIAVVSILLSPFIDLLTALSRKVAFTFLSLGTVYRGGLLLLMFLSITLQLIFNQENINKKIKFYFGLIIVHSSLFMLTRDKALNLSGLLTELSSLSRFIFFPISYLFFLLFKECDDCNEVKIRKNIKISGLIYSVMIIFPTITGLGFNSYSLEGLTGYVGWFHGANEISLILSIISFEFIRELYEVLDESEVNQKKLQSNLIGLFLLIIAAIITGTKAAIFTIMSLLLITTLYIFRNTDRNQHDALLTVIVFLGALLFSFTPASKNLTKIVDSSTEKSFIEILLSGRLYFLELVRTRYKYSSMVKKIFGLGVLNTNSSGKYVQDKLIEMDFFEIFYRYGPLFLLLTLIPFLISIYQQYKIQLDKETSFSLLIDLMALGTFLFFALSMGHVISAPSVSYYLVLFLIYNFTYTKSGSDYVE